MAACARRAFLPLKIHSLVGGAENQSGLEFARPAMLSSRSGWIQSETGAQAASLGAAEPIGVVVDRHLPELYFPGVLRLLLLLYDAFCFY